ncbi:aminopeptidase, partial [Enterobacter mori]
VPEHINQLSQIVVEDEDINELLKTLKHNQIISSNVGHVSSTQVLLNGNYVKLISVGLGNLKTSDSSDFLIVFGKLFQHLKNDR